MNSRGLFVGLLLVSCLSALATAQSAACRDASEESHHRVLLESSGIRMLLLELPRIASTDSFCYANPYVYIVLGHRQSSATAEGKGTFSRDWSGSETQLIYEPQKQVIRNESGSTLREVVVELPRVELYDPLTDSLTSDMFPSDLGTVKPSWTVTFTRGGVKFSKVQLAAGDTVSLNSAGHVLIALTDLYLRRKLSGNSEEVSSAAQDVSIMDGGPASELVNAGRSAARFILIEY